MNRGPRALANVVARNDVAPAFNDDLTRPFTYQRFFLSLSMYSSLRSLFSSLFKQDCVYDLLVTSRRTGTSTAKHGDERAHPPERSADTPLLDDTAMLGSLIPTSHISTSLITTAVRDVLVFFLHLRNDAIQDSHL